MRTLGENIARARRRRRLSVRSMAERMYVSPDTVQRVEKGDPGVSIGVIASALLVLGMERQLSEIAATERDGRGVRESEEHLPQRIHDRSSVDDDLDF